ncbi:MAG: HD domain-containing protein [Desulfobacteraceae bacterium]|nr:HD domain-containing protein [Desulfobacteraceae bacterium]MBC2757808.1 HD domain-containing protein [Desulfobacteraceae bacterium]
MGFQHSQYTRYPKSEIASIMKRIEEFNYLQDIDAILDKILDEARHLSNADAGSIFIVEDDHLRFGYVHNDTLFKKDEANEEIYVDFSVPIDDQSIVGYVALTGNTLVIDDAYNLPSGSPFMLNSEYDLKAGYKTRSILAVPLYTFHGRMVGVMQLINAKDENGQVIQFLKKIQDLIPLLANNAAVAIDRGIMNREMILRMVKMAELRDPTETGAHVQRVGAYSAEIYQRWATRHGIDKQEKNRKKDLIRLAAMLHDVGKVGIPDNILKKSDKLTDREFDTIKWHTVYGGRLFMNQTSSLDKMSMQIALNHHEKWNGKGYPGKIEDIMKADVKLGPPKRKEEIPLSARIVSLADVYDALISRRSYKDPWSDKHVLEVIEAEAGNHFDPEIVKIFFQILPVIKAIRLKYKES